MTFKAIKGLGKTLERELYPLAEKLGIAPPGPRRTPDSLRDQWLEEVDLEQTEHISTDDFYRVTNKFLLATAFDCVIQFRDMDEATFNQAPKIILDRLCAMHNLVGTLQMVSKLQPSGMYLSDVFASLGKAGAAKRHAKMTELRQWTIEKYRVGTWSSANQAAHDLQACVIEHGRTIGAILSTANAQRTIAEWIRKSV